MPTRYLEAPGVVRGFLLPIQTLDTAATKLAPIFFQTMPTITDSKTANYGTSEAPGRSEPYSIFQSSSARTIALDMTYVAMNQKFDVQWVAQQISRLQALLYPIYTRRKQTNAAFIPPPMILLNLGYRYVNLPCVVTNYSVQNSDDDPYEVFTMLPMISKITLALQTTYPYGYAPGHDDIASKYIGEISEETSGRGDAVLPDQVSPDYSRLVTDSPISLKQENNAAEMYQRSIEVRTTQSFAYSRPLSEVAFKPEDLTG